MTNMKFENRTKISYTFLRVMSRLTEMDKKTRHYGTDELLHDAEIHMIKAIRENEGIHVTGLADLVGVTKGAVSQILRKLECKGMIVKETDPKNLSRLKLRLTEKGETAYLRHEELHREFDAYFQHALQGATEAEQAFLHRFLNSLDEELDEVNKP